MMEGISNSELFELSEFQIEHDRLIVLVGPSASGKTTLLRDLLVNYRSTFEKSRFEKGELYIFAKNRQPMHTEILSRFQMDENFDRCVHLTEIPFEKFSRIFLDDRQTLCIFDDCVRDFYGSRDSVEKFASLCEFLMHHRHITVILLMHTMRLNQSALSRAVSSLIQNTVRYLFVFGSAFQQAESAYIQRLLYTGLGFPIILKALSAAQSIGYRYIMIDLNAERNEKLRFRTGLLPDSQYVLLPTTTTLQKRKNAAKEDDEQDEQEEEDETIASRTALRRRRRRLQQQ